MSYETQNKFIQDYIAPIMLNLDFKTVFDNIRMSKEQRLMADLEKAGVFASLCELDILGTSEERMFREMQRQIEGAKYYEIDRSIVDRIMNFEDAYLVDIYNTKIMDRYDPDKYRPQSTFAAAAA